MKKQIVLLAFLATALVTYSQKIDDSSPLIHYLGDWHTDTDFKCYGSTQHWTVEGGATASFEFTGTEFEIVYYTDKKGGTMSVIVDGIDRTKVSCHSDSLSYNKTYPFRDTYGKHEVILVNTYSDKFIVVDAIKIIK